MSKDYYDAVWVPADTSLDVTLAQAKVAFARAEKLDGVKMGPIHRDPEAEKECRREGGDVCHVYMASTVDDASNAA